MQYAVTRNIFRCLVGVLFLAAGAALAAPANNSMETINLAGRQRMLTQRIVKNYTQRGLGVLAEQAERQTQDSVSQFETALTTLQQRAANMPSIHPTLATINSDWSRLKQILAQKPGKESAQSLDQQAEKLLNASNALTQAFQEQSGVDVGRWVNTAGRTRMLALRLAKFQLLRQYGLGTAASRDLAEQTRNELTGALATLSQAPVNTAAIRQELGLASTQWQFFEQALSRADSDPTQIATTSERIVEVMDQITQRYMALSK